MPILLSAKQIQKLSKYRRARAKRQRRGLDPVTSERYFRKEMRGMIKKHLLPATEKLAQMIKQDASKIAIADFIDWTLRVIKIEFDLRSPGITAKWLLMTSTESRQAVMASLNESLGIDMEGFYDTPEIKEVLALSAQEASNLIKTIPEQYLGKVAMAVHDDFIGKPLPGGKSLLAHIKEEYFSTDRRARTIARDQTKKVNSSLQQYRQESIGISEYIWRTVKDNRVVGKPGGKYPTGNKAHGNHWMMEGMMCKWSDPSVYSDDKGKTWKKRKEEMPKDHPGQDILCRCHAEAVIDIQRILQFAKAA